MIRMVAAFLASLVAMSAHPVGAGQLTSLPYSNARAYRQSSEMVWETVQEVADAWGLKTDTKDGPSHLLVSDWKRFSDFNGSPFFQAMPTLPADGAQLVPAEFQLHLFVSPFVEPARVYVATVLRTDFEQNRYVHHGVGFAATEFFRELEARLGSTGTTIPVASSSGSNPCLATRGVGSPTADAVDLTPVRRLTDFEFLYPSVQSEALVILDVTIGFDGAVVASRVVSVNGAEITPPEVFAQAAKNIVTLWRYRPAERDGCPVSVMATVVMSFGLDDSRPLFYSRTLPERERGFVPGSVSRVYTTDGDGLQNPRLLEETTPRYTPAAQGQQIEGEVWLDAVVLPDGTVGDIHVTKSLDMKYGLDGAAVIAAKQWRFDPGTRDGEPVAVQVGIALEFYLQ